MRKTIYSLQSLVNHLSIITIISSNFQPPSRISAHHPHYCEMELESGLTRLDSPLRSPEERPNKDKEERQRVSRMLAQRKFRLRREQKEAATRKRIKELESHNQALEKQVAELSSRGLSAQSAQRRIEEFDETVSTLQNNIKSIEETAKSIQLASDSLHNIVQAPYHSRRPQYWGPTQPMPALRKHVPESNTSYYHQQLNPGFISPVNPIASGVMMPGNSNWVNGRN
jgi:hypothetical protein